MGPVGTKTMQAGDDQLAWKNSARLADGREIIYFDETPGLNRALARDAREGLAVAPAPGTWSAEQVVRWDPLLGEWVIIAAQRQDRTFLPPPDQCPLDPSAPGRPTEIPADGYDVVVFENRFPSLRGASAIPGTKMVPGGRGGRTRSGRRPVAAAPGLRALRGRLLHLRPRRVVREPDRAAGPDRDGGLGRPHRRRSAPSRASSRSTASRTAVRRSASPCTTRTARSTRSRSLPRAPGRWWRGRGPRRAGRPEPVRRSRRRRAGGRHADRGGQRSLDSVRPACRPLAVRGAALPHPPGARPGGPGQRGPRRVR